MGTGLCFFRSQTGYVGSSSDETGTHGQEGGVWTAGLRGKVKGQVGRGTCVVVQLACTLNFDPRSIEAAFRVIAVFVQFERHGLISTRGSKYKVQIFAERELQKLPRVLVATVQWGYFDLPCPQSGLLVALMCFDISTSKAVFRVLPLSGVKSR